MTHDPWVHRGLRRLNRAMANNDAVLFGVGALSIVGVFLALLAALYLFVIASDRLEGQGGSGIAGQIIMSFIAGHFITKWTITEQYRRAHFRGFCYFCKHELSHNRYLEIKAQRGARRPEA